MALGCTVNSRSWKGKQKGYSKKIACQFTVEQFSRINSYADSRGMTFAAAVRDLIFIVGPLKPV